MEIIGWIVVGVLALVGGIVVLERVLRAVMLPRLGMTAIQIKALNHFRRAWREQTGNSMPASHEASIADMIKHMPDTLADAVGSGRITPAEAMEAFAPEYERVIHERAGKIDADLGYPVQPIPDHKTSSECTNPPSADNQRKAVQTARPRSSLCKASADGDEDFLKSLRNGENVNDIQDDGTTPIWWACSRGHCNIVRLLLDAGADPDIGDGLGRTPLAWAAEQGNYTLAKMLLEGGASADKTENNYNVPPLRWAAGGGHVQVVELLVSVGADVNSRDNRGFTPLHVAASKNYLAVTDLLVSYGADLDVIDSSMGFTPLHCAAVAGHKEMMSWLKNRGADPHLHSRHNLTADELYQLKRT